MTPPRTSRSSYPVSWAAVILGVMCAATVLAAAGLDTVPAPGSDPTPAASASGEPPTAGAWLFP